MSTNFAALTLGPDRRYINTGLAPSNRRLLRELLGEPVRGKYPVDCISPNNPAFMRHVVKAKHGHINLYGYHKAVHSLVEVMKDIERYQPEAFKALRSWGVLCCRRVRGGQSPSIHSWGAAIDIGFVNTRTGKGELCPLGSQQVQIGLLTVYPYFRDHGWYWGGGFSRRDFMHWEASEALIKKWMDQ